MKSEYNFSESKANPYTKKLSKPLGLKQVRREEETEADGVQNTRHNKRKS